MNEATAKAILKDIVDYLNLSTLDGEAMRLWLYHRLAKRGYDCTAKERTFDELYEDRQTINLAFSVMGKLGVVTDMEKKEFKRPVRIPFRPVAVSVVFDHEAPDKDFNIKGTGVDGAIFVMRLAASATKWNKAHRCGLCHRMFFSKNAGSAKWCHNSCKTTNSKINTKKREWDTDVLFWHKLRAREVEILKKAKKVLMAKNPTKEAKNGS